MTYIEPFVGGGAMLFYMLRSLQNIKKAIINDTNVDLMNCYLSVKDNPLVLLLRLWFMNDKFISCKTKDDKKQFYYAVRERYNREDAEIIAKSADFIFLNKTCFNGLYRVNKSGEFNVPMGTYTKPNICDTVTIHATHSVLKNRNVKVLSGDFSDVVEHIEEPSNTFIYLDPPYHPISSTSSFEKYTEDGFGIEEQMRLKAFCDYINDMGCMFALSNSCGEDGFLVSLYSDYNIHRVEATRSINANPKGRGKIKELIITNYPTTPLSQSL